MTQWYIGFDNKYAQDRLGDRYNKIKIMLEETICLVVVRKRRKNRL